MAKTPISLAGIVATVALAASLSGCAGFGPAPLPGEHEASVRAKLGEPSNVYSAGTETMLEYATGPSGQYTWMARIGADGRMLSYEQVLTDETFGKIRIGADNREAVLRLVGRPAETSYLALRDLTVWSYRYKQSGVWDSMMHVHFSQDGIVRQMMAGPDPEREERRGFFR